MTDLSRGGINLSHSVMVGAALGAKLLGLVNLSFVIMDFLFVSVIQVVCLMRRNNQNSGICNGIGEYRNRDYRFVGCTFLPDRVSYVSRTEDGRQLYYGC